MMEPIELPPLFPRPGVPRVPSLLVSVRSPEEALSAVDGGADILDVKEPSRGSLGMASVAVIDEIAQRLAALPRPLPLSAACGEVLEWRTTPEVPTLPHGLTFAKLGLSRLAAHHDWREEWLRVRERFDERSRSPLHWVAVAYADADEAQSPPILHVLDAALETGCSGLLVDTFTKSNRTLTDWCAADFVCELAERSHSSGLFLALAGRLSRESLRQLSDIPADVLAIRSAACDEGDRTGRVSTQRIASFRETMQREFTTGISCAFARDLSLTQP